MLTSTTVNTPAAGSVVTASMADDSVTGAKLVSSAVTTAKIADANVTTAKIADANVTTAKIADDAVTIGKIADAALVIESEGIGSNDNDTTLPTSAAVKDYVDTQVAGKDNTDEITEGSTNLYFTNARADARITNALKDEDNMASNSATHIPSQQSVKAYVDAQTTDETAEGSSNLYFTNARADARIAAADTDDLSEGSTNLYYTDARVGTYISGNRTYGNITTTGYLAGPSTFTIDPAAVGDNTGTLVIAGNLQVDGTTTTINSTTLTVDDKLVTLASGSANAGAANGAGIEVDISGATNPSITYDGTNDEWDFNKDINVTGTISTSGYLDIASRIRHIGDTDTYLSFANADDFRIVVGNSTRAAFNTSKIHFNQEGINQDFQVEGQGTGNEGLLYVDASANKVGIATSSPSSTLTVSGTIESLKDDTYGSNEGGQLMLRAPSASTTTAKRYSLDTFNVSGNSTFRLISEDDSNGANGVVRMALDTKGTFFFTNDLSSYGHNTYAHAAVFSRNSTPAGTVVIEDSDVSSGIGNTVLRCFLRDQDPATTAIFIDFADGGGRVGSVSHNDDGGGVSYNTTSDYRLKENVNYDWDALSLVNQLKPAKFNFLSNPAKTVQGFLAHEVSDIVPSSVRGNKDHIESIGTVTDSDGNVVYEGVYEHFCKTDEGQTWTKTGEEPIYQQLDYSRIVPLLTKAVQELSSQVDELKAEIQELKG
jgi:hypothetical protein